MMKKQTDLATNKCFIIYIAEEKLQRNSRTIGIPKVIFKTFYIAEEKLQRNSITIGVPKVIIKT